MLHTKKSMVLLGMGAKPDPFAGIIDMAVYLGSD